MVHNVYAVYRALTRLSSSKITNRCLEVLVSCERRQGSDVEIDDANLMSLAQLTLHQVPADETPSARD
jgi:hypothetical protein